MNLVACGHFVSASPVGLAETFGSSYHRPIPGDSEARPSTLARRLVLGGLLRAGRLWALFPFGTLLYLIRKPKPFRVSE